MCVQNFDDSRGPAIRITYRISLRSSSLWDPRHPLLKVVMNLTVNSTRMRGAANSLGSVSVSFSSGRHLEANHQLSRADSLLKHLVLFVFQVFVNGGSKSGVQSVKVNFNTRCIGTPSKPPLHGDEGLDGVIMILPQVHLRKPCYDFTFL